MNHDKLNLRVGEVMPSELLALANERLEQLEANIAKFPPRDPGGWEASSEAAAVCLA